MEKVARFAFSTAGTILFGEGTAYEAIPRLAEGGRRIFLLTGSHPERVSDWINSLVSFDIILETLVVKGEPTVDGLCEAVSRARAFGADQVAGMGGGSVVDMAKAVAALSTNEGNVEDYLEVVGLGKPLRNPSLRCAVFPTTAGTGAEVTRNAVVSTGKEGVKISMRSPFLLPSLAVVDPVFSYSMPPQMTAATGMDALVQCIEAWVSRRGNPLTDIFCVKGITLALKALPRAVRDGDDHAARRDMALAATLSGLALANAGLGAVHGFAGTLGGRYGMPHGVVCAALLPAVLRVNLRALRERKPEADALEKLAELARQFTGRTDVEAEAAIDAAAELVRVTGIPSLSGYGLREKDIPELVQQAAKASSMKGNPVDLTESELTEILKSVVN